MNALVIPTNRQQSISDFLWKLDRKHWNLIIVVEDNPTRTFDLGLEYVEHYSWEEIDKDLGDKSWIISRRDSAIRSYGFLAAYRLGATFICTLDDDCYIAGAGHQCYGGNDFVNQHMHNLFCTPRWTESAGVRTRGIPYYNKGKLQNVMFSVGLWDTHPDYDSVQTLSKSYEPLPDLPTRIIPKGQYFPFCGMNFAFRREATPLCYFALMGEGYPYRRFDDIWFGVIAKKICDHLEWFVSCGKPRVIHTKASDPFTNLVKEAPGIQFNEEFWNIVDGVDLTESTASGCMREMGLNFQQSKSDYIQKYGHAIETWATLFANP